MRLLIFLVLLGLPASLWANCGGIDLRPTLNDAQRSEIAARIKDNPFLNGNHWKATKGTRAINIIGTMHIDDPRMDSLAERLAPVIRTADQVLVEATLEDQKALERAVVNQPDLAFLTGKTRLI